MFEAKHYVFEVAGEPAGILVREGNGFVFFAACEWAWPCDRHRYASLRAAERALCAAYRGSAVSECGMVEAT